jgi:hypothetical protein
VNSLKNFLPTKIIIMKVLIILALAVAAASASFSGSFSQQAKPLLQQAISKIQADLAIHKPARNSAEAGFQTEFINALNNQAQDIINVIENGVNAAQTIAQTVVSSFHSAISQLQAVGANVIENGQNIISNLVSNIWGSIFGSNSRALSPALSAIVAQVASNPEFVNLVHQSSFYQCLSAGGIVVTHAYLQQLSASGQLGAGLLQDPVIAGCVNQAGGLHDLISGSEVVNWAQNFAAQLGLTSLIDSVILQVAGEELGYLIIDALQSRGFFGDIWGSISDTASNAWNSLSSGVVSAGQYIASVASQAWQSAQEKFEAIKQLAIAFVQGGITTAQLATQQAAQEFIDFIAPYQADLGQLYTQVVSQVTAIWDGIQLPQWQS